MENQGEGITSAVMEDQLYLPLTMKIYGMRIDTFFDRLAQCPLAQNISHHCSIETFLEIPGRRMKLEVLGTSACKVENIVLHPMHEKVTV